MAKRKAKKKKTTKVPHRSTLTRQAPTSSLTCVCGDVRDEHGGDLDYPGSTACNACGTCCAYEAAR